MKTWGAVLTGLAVSVISAEAPATAQGAACAILAERYDDSLKEIEFQTANAGGSRVAARVADRQALLDVMLAEKCPPPANLTSRGYAAAAQSCAASNRLYVSPEAAAVVAKASGVKEEGLSSEPHLKPPAEACDRSKWTYIQPVQPGG